ncbi:hypothetical protein BJY04DRAFT_109145 [Aspergillus karnatakaensis]|uniref:uncharacterized protein n=1 Tax=Aspergillus karnatakaensis TaxID=1810916 RepID=UPI003CCD28ED
MGVNHRVKTKYVFRLPLPIPFLKAKQTSTKEPGMDSTYEGFDAESNVYAPVTRTVHVEYESDEDVGPLDVNVSSTTQRKKLVSWEGVEDQARAKWTVEQEEKLAHARAELARCQKAWSSEQDIWLQCVCAFLLSHLTPPAYSIEQARSASTAVSKRDQDQQLKTPGHREG